VFNIGPLEFVLLVAVALLVFGPERLPELARDAGRMLRALRDIAQGARTQLNSELGPEFADFDLSSLNPRTAIKNALLGDDDFTSLNPREAIQRALRGEDDPAPPAVDLSKPASPPLAPDERPPVDPEAT
jgi:sec-independent protein translocase protein TatB